jgi:hypothetical protein
MSTKKSIICFFTCIFVATILTSCTGEVSSNGSGGGYIAGNCEDLKSRGLSDFRPGDPNYTNRRDGDADGVACESD